MGSAYCATTDLSQGLNAVALSSIPLAEQTAACVSASAILDSYFNGRWPLPLLTWDFSVTIAAVHIAVKLALDARGSSPLANGDETVERNYERAIEWAKGVQRQTVHPTVTYQTPAAAYVLPQVSSPNCARGW